MGSYGTSAKRRRRRNKERKPSTSSRRQQLAGVMPLGLDMYSRFDQVDEFEDERKASAKEYRKNFRQAEREQKHREEVQGSKKQNAEGGGRTAICTVKCEGVVLKLTLTPKFLQRTFMAALVEPYFKAFNKKRQKLDPDAPFSSAADLESLEIDGSELLPRLQDYPGLIASELLYASIEQLLSSMHRSTDHQCNDLTLVQGRLQGRQA